MDDCEWRDARLRSLGTGYTNEQEKAPEVFSGAFSFCARTERLELLDGRMPTKEKVEALLLSFGKTEAFKQS